MRKRMLAWLLTVSMIFGLTTNAIAATPSSAPEGLDVETVVEESAAVDVDLPDNDELFAAYVEQLMYGGSGVALFGTQGKDRLTAANEIALYEALEKTIKEVAAGTRTDTQSISVSLSGSDNSWNDADDLKNSMRKVMHALMADLPAELYWFDKTVGYSYSYSTSTYAPSKISFAVSANYSPDGQKGGYTVDNSKITTADKAIKNAKAIVEKFKNSSDDAKLIAYKDEICELTEYNHDAADNDPPYGDPWQLIWVFDQDPETTVVCEGYSKAFQYLCDLTTFNNSSIECYTVSGVMGGGTGAGGHMWNIVRIDRNSYLVDVTNCDAGTVGFPDKLFLTGASGSVSGQYDITGKGFPIAYNYDPDQITLWVEDILTLSSSDYTYTNNSTPGIKTDVSDKIIFEKSASAANPVYDPAGVDISGVATQAELKTESGLTGMITYKLDGATVEWSALNKQGLDAGPQTLTAVYDDDDNHGEVEIEFTVEQATIATSGWTWAPNSFTYTGQEQSIALTNVDEKVSVTYSGEKGTNAGTYNATATFTVKDSYAKNYKLDAPTKTTPWTITKAPALTLSDTYSVIYSNTNTQIYMVNVTKLQETYPGLKDVTVTGVSTTNTGNILNDNAEMTENGVSFVLRNGLTTADVGKTAGIVITLKNKNYENSHLTLTVSVIDKINVDGKLSLGGITVTYGDSYTVAGSYSGTKDTTSKWTYSYSGTGSTTYNSTVAPKAAGTYTVTAVYEDEIPEGDVPGHTGSVTATITIEKKSVTITGLSAGNKVYDGNTTATATGAATVSGRVGSDDVTVTAGTAAFEDKNVGTGKTVTFTGYELAGSDAANYTLSTQPANVEANITPRQITITGVAATDRDYVKDNVKVALTGGELVGVIANDNLGFTLGDGTISDAKAGSNKVVTTAITLSGADAGNYTLTQPTGITVAISKINRNLTVTVPSLSLLPNELSGAATLIFDDVDGDAKADFNLSENGFVSVSAKNKVYTFTALKNGTVTVTFTIPETDNYNAAAVTCEVTVIKEAITDVTATGAEGDKVAASIEGNTIKVTGVVTDYTAITIDPVLASVAGVTLTSDIEKDVSGVVTKLVVKAGGNVIAEYAVDTSAVVTVAPNVELKEVSPAVEKDDLDSSLSSVTDFKDTKAEDTIAAAAKEISDIVDTVKNKTDEDIIATVTVTITPLKYDDGTASDSGSASGAAKMTVGVTPTYTIVDKEGNELDSGELTELSGKIKISVNLPADFNPNMAKHTHGEHGETVEYLEVTVINGVATWYQSTFSEVELIADMRGGSITFKYNDGDGTEETVYYTALDLGKELPSPKGNPLFRGWTFTETSGISGAQKVLTGEILDAIQSSGPLVAEASFYKQYNVTVNASDGGTVTGAGLYTEGETVTVRAVANSGYRFVGWRENGTTVNTNATYTFNATKDRVLTAVFEPISSGNPGGGSTPSKPSYQITVSSTSNGTVTVTPTSAKSGTKVTITAAPDRGYKVGSVTVTDNDGNSVSVTDNGDGTYTFTMPDSPVTVSATFTSIGGNGGGGGGSSSSNPSYQITVPSTSNGTVTVTPTSAKSGTKVTITATPDSGYKVGDVIVRGVSGNTVAVTSLGNNQYSFTMPSGKVTVAVTFVPIQVSWTNLFTDVSESDWFYGGVAYVVQNGLMQGVGGGRFNPSGTTTRGMIVTILYRLEGEPTVSQSTFTDVEAGQYYTEAVAWAAANKIVEGYGNNTFGPNDAITREQMATILYRYADYKGYDVSELADLSSYNDADKISNWALTAMRWANKKGLITGRITTTLVPKETAIRAEAAVILARFCQDAAGVD